MIIDLVGKPYVQRAPVVPVGPAPAHRTGTAPRPCRPGDQRAGPLPPPPATRRGACGHLRTAAGTSVGHHACTIGPVPETLQARHLRAVDDAGRSGRAPR
jgi:hypothetical protein